LSLKLKKEKQNVGSGEFHMVSIRRVFYSYNNLLTKPFSLDVLVQDDDVLKVDEHSQFETKEDFFAAIERLLPVIKGDVEEEYEDRQG
jgi:hypothetical protein